MAATAADLVGAIQPLTQLTDRWLKSATLNLFESGVIDAGPAGRASLKRGPREAAAIAVGLLAAPSTLQAGRYAKGILNAGRQRGAIIDPNEVLHTHRLGRLAETALSRPNFWDALTVLVQGWEILEDGLRHYTELPGRSGLNREWKTSLIVGFSGVPHYSAHIELETTEDQPLNETGFNNPSMFLGMDADWMGDKTAEIENADAELMERIAHSSTQEFDHRVIIALGRRLAA